MACKRKAYLLGGQNSHELRYVSAERSGRYCARYRGPHCCVRHGARRCAQRSRVGHTCTDWAADHGEGVQVLHYEVGQKYEVCAAHLAAQPRADRRQAHYDYFHDALNVQNGGQRVATVLLYLYATRQLPGRRC